MCRRCAIAQNAICYAYVIHSRLGLAVFCQVLDLEVLPLFLGESLLRHGEYRPDRGQGLLVVVVAVGGHQSSFSTSMTLLLRPERIVHPCHITNTWSKRL